MLGKVAWPDPSSTPEPPLWEERAYSYSLSSDFHVCTADITWTQAHTKIRFLKTLIYESMITHRLEFLYKASYTKLTI